jgi:hypothetical protein
VKRHSPLQCKLFGFWVGLFFATYFCSAEALRYHTLVVDAQNKIIPWFTPVTNAFDNYLDKCWAWAVAAPNDANGLPISYLYSSWTPGNPPTPAGWENDVGEKIPNWVESARLYYQYCGDRAPLDYVKRLVDYSLVHGQTPTNHAWPDFPVGATGAGDTEFIGLQNIWGIWGCHVDLAADIGFSMFRMYQVYGDAKYREKAIHVADVLASHIVPGSATNSPWPYVVHSQTGTNKSRYAASWDGALKLFDLLIGNNQGSVSNYTSARATLKNWLLTYPMQNGNWVDGHSDVKINGTNNWSTTCGSDMCLYLLENPGWDTNVLTDVPKLLKWTEDNFVNVSTGDGLAGQYHGAYVPAEQFAYMWRMGYQTARLGAQYALWYEASGDVAYKDRAYRCLSYNTYMMQDSGQSSDGPTTDVGYWWSDCYGEATRMYYYGMAAVPEWSPPGENHLLRSSSVVTSIFYASNSVSYTTFDDGSTETLRLTFTPASVLVNGAALPERSDLSQAGWMFTPSNGVLRVRHDTGTNVYISVTPATTNRCVTILNADSESGFSVAGGGYIANNWIEWEASPNVTIGYDETTIIHGGAHAQRISVSGGTNGTSGGVFQRVPLTAGQGYTISVWVYAADNATVCSLGVDPTGGTNSNSGVIWSAGSTNVAWVQQTRTGTAMASYITVFYKVASSDNNQRNGYFDDTTPAAPTHAPQLLVQPDGIGLTLKWAECPEARLEHADSLAAPMNWMVVTNQISYVGGQKTATLTPTEGAVFFRLILE